MGLNKSRAMDMQALSQGNANGSYHLQENQDSLPRYAFDSVQSTQHVIHSPMTLILAGPQGSGKGTQAAKLVEYFGYNHFEMGGKFREIAKHETELGRRVKSVLEKGDNVDIEVVMQIVENYLETRRAGEKLMFDGIPRTQDQEVAFAEKLHGKDRESDARMLLIDLSREDATKNIVYRGIKTGRTDDQNPAVVANRLNGFYTRTMPVVETYRQRGQLLRVDGRPEADMDRASIVEKRIQELQSMDSASLNGEFAELQDLLGERTEIEQKLEYSKEVVFQRVLDVFRKSA